jgi:drug/metabolite transporter (DMT)-like permease
VPPTSLISVLASAALHAYWNLLLKRAGGGQLVVGMSKLVEGLLLVPIVVSGVLLDPGAAPRLSVLAAVGGALVGIYYVCLGAAYRHADLSFTYPIARGAVVALLPIGGFLAFGERLHGPGRFGLPLIVLGILVQLRCASTRNLPGAAFALAAAVTAAGYTLWDKHAVGAVPPLLYFASGGVEMRACWLEHRCMLIQVAAANGLGYVLVLHALQTSISSYVIGLRQASIPFAAVLAWSVLGERPKPLLWWAVLAIVAGCALVAVSTGA